MRTYKRTLWAALPLLAISGTAAATEAATQDQIEALDQKIRVLERKLELSKQSAAAKTKSAGTASFGEKGASIKSADGDYELQIRGQFQFDNRLYLDEDSGDDSFVLRRLRPSLRFKLGERVSGRVTPEFAGDSASIVDAYVDLAAISFANLRVGKFKGPVGFERLISASYLPFVERSYPTELVPNRDIGVELWADVFNERLSYELAFSNGTPDGRDSASRNPDDDFETSARLVFHPFDGAGIGIAGSTGDKSGSGNSVLPRYRSPGQLTIFQYAGTVVADGEHTRWSPQAWLYRGPLGLSGEYVASRSKLALGDAHETLEHEAWAVTASWVLTGEKASVTSSVKPNAPLGRGAGAWEVVARYTGIEFDDDAFTGFADPGSAVSKAQSFVLGVNWYLTSNLKAVFNYAQTRFDGGSAGGDRPDEEILFSRLQIAF